MKVQKQSLQAGRLAGDGEENCCFVWPVEVLENPSAGVTFLSGTEKYFLDIQQDIDLDAERQKLEEELDYAKGFVQSVEKKLSNDRFVNNAPPPVVERERKKLADGQARIKILEENLANLG